MAKGITRKDLTFKSGRPLTITLGNSVRKYERRYEISSDAMAHAVRTGKMKETKEISKWLQHHSVLKKLTGTGGTHSKAT